MSESLDILLKDLRLPAFRLHCEEYEALAVKKAWGYRRYLAKLCEQEAARRYEVRIRNWTKEARLPRGKHFVSLDLNELPKAVRQTVIDLKENTQWALQADNVLLIGPSGVGKSHIAAALGLHLIEQGIRVKWLQATTLVQMLQQAKQELDLMSMMSKLDKYRVLIIDDIGYVKKTDSETQVLFEFIAHRYESGSLVITSNQPFSHWDQIFPDTLMTVAAIDRIIHHATIVEIDTDSYRRKHQKQQ